MDNFSDWYNDVIEKAQLIDKRYPVKGMDVWLPYGWSIMRAVDAFTRSEMERTNHGEVKFPLLIPVTEFNKEADQIKGFGGEVYWVTKGGHNDLDIPLVVRPTSETAMYPMFSLWVRSHADLPLKTYQIVSVFRYETKMTRSFMRVREIHFFEAHTAHADYEDAERQMREDAEIFSRIAKKICIPYIAHQRPDWDKFPGAYYTVGADALLPEKKTLQIGTWHQYRDNFAKAYDIKYEGKDGQFHYAHQTTYGMSERLLGAIVAVHGDDKGLVLPPGIAPHQAVIVPILFKGKEEPVLQACRALADTLRGAGFRVHVDERDQTAGFKFNDWEMRGVPIRIEIGPKDVEKGSCVVVPRIKEDVKSLGGLDFGAGKVFVPVADLPGKLGGILDDFSAALLARATKFRDENIVYPKTIDETKTLMGLLRVGWCGTEACGKKLETTSEKAVLGVPQGDVKFQGACIACGTATTTCVDVAKTY
ncbi:MAG TPA: proline--tRNA ligase [Candidatus Thermoplasmatota archaeon]|nr:proline--tRNA ligase [Candidatus Thermoplasmatota archaeon]